MRVSSKNRPSPSATILSSAAVRNAMYSQPPPCRSNIHPCGQWHHQCIDRHRDECRRRPPAKQTQHQEPAADQSEDKYGYRRPSREPVLFKEFIVPGNVKTSGLSRPWVNITAPTCDSQDQNPQVDTVLGEEMTIHRNSRLRIKCYDQKKGFRTRRHFVSFKKSRAEAFAVPALLLTQRSGHQIISG